METIFWGSAYLAIIFESKKKVNRSLDMVEKNAKEKKKTQNDQNNKP